MPVSLSIRDCTGVHPPVNNINLHSISCHSWYNQIQRSIHSTTLVCCVILSNTLQYSLLPHLTTLQTYLLPFCLDSFS
ncbi:Chromosome segregation ATPase [Giardia duodenalis assemblage B]|uniref:Chromosome segregation ATPase n=1 Tax=Giardia duodenalis assemblage B TaxID=1394984 RepID=A0A132NTI1_GIAIN|nr:Chromosome segregation ATPase [Giardia intestinalis assemblage B]